MKSHRGNHKVFSNYQKAKEFLDANKDAWIVQTAWSETDGFSEWKVYFAD
jgi:hypothetical protein